MMRHYNSTFPTTWKRKAYKIFCEADESENPIKDRNEIKIEDQNV